MANVNDTYFDGYYKDIWRTILPAELTSKEIDFILPFFHLNEKSFVLDLMCGAGRHSIELARKGINVTAVDNLLDYTAEISDVSEKEQLPLKVIQHDVASFKSSDQFDLVICMGNSLNFFDADTTRTILKNIQACLKPGGHLLINTWSLAEIVFKNFIARGWSREGEIKFLNDSKLLFYPTRVETESIMIGPNGTETKQAVDYIFSVNEMEQMISESGLLLQNIYSIPGKKLFSLGEPRAYIVAAK